MNDYNPGIADLVSTLQAEGFETTDSGDGVTNIGKFEGALPFKHVFIRTYKPVEDAGMLYKFCRKRRMPLVPNGHGGGWSIQATYDPVNKVGVLALIEEA